MVAIPEFKSKLTSEMSPPTEEERRQLHQWVWQRDQRIAQLEAALRLAWGYLDTEHITAKDLIQIGAPLMDSALETGTEP